MAEYSSPFASGPGGVMTDDVGVITGDLELRTEAGEDGLVSVYVRYEEADEWYRLRGASCVVHDPRDHRALHMALLGVLNRPAG
ncbi:hypothetical protein ACLLO4_01030 [Kutzneria viridogrisea]|uniref:Uncharacterized protein n=2 Tax=Kutzneria TaxID=43356 RepID=W5WL62_9PSEU|nr:hypothetical protein [Kutzneria albida]AHI01954.1 hypothetical protein KALB_8597 [Kutzneria albida DSM 43870]